MTSDISLAKQRLIQGDLRNLPESLATLAPLPRWAVWRLTAEKSNGRPGKRPYQPEQPNKPAAVDQVAHWCTYQDALRVYEAGGFDGIGLLLKDHDVAAFDIDNCIDPSTGRIAPFAKALVEIAQSYTEISVSGTGLHIIGRGSLKDHHRIRQVAGHEPVRVESYCNTNRFVVVTGVPLDGTRDTLRDITAEMKQLEALLDSRQPIDPASLLDALRGTKAAQVSSGTNANVSSPRAKSKPAKWILDLIDKEAPAEADLSVWFHRVVCELHECGWSQVEIAKRLLGRPIVPERYEKEGRLDAEIARCIEKAESSASEPPSVASPSITLSRDEPHAGSATIGQETDGASEQHTQRPDETDEKDDDRASSIFGPIKATPFTWTDPAEISPRDWLYGRFLVRGFVSLTVAPSGVGKSSLTIVEALAMASGRKLLHDEPTGPLKVWMWNGEDPRHELSRRIAAAALAHKVDPTQIGDRLFVDTGHETEIVFRDLPTHAAMDESETVAAVREEIIRRQIDVVVIDPFIASHGASENDNMAIDRIAKTWARIAEKARCAIHLVHHTRKLGGFDADIEHSRGAGALIAATRAARTLNVMSRKEANAAGIENHRSFVRLADGNPNLAPPAKYPQWLRLASVSLPNGRDGSPGDEIGVIKTADLDDPALLAAIPPLSEEAVRKVVQAVSAGKLRSNSQAQAWVGHVIGPTFDLDPGAPGARGKSPDKATISRIQKALFDEGYIKYVKEKNAKGKLEEWVLVGSKGEALLSPEPTGEEESDV